MVCSLGNSRRVATKNGYFTWVLKDGQVATGHSDPRVDVCPRPTVWTPTGSRRKGLSRGQASSWSQFEQDTNFWSGLKPAESQMDHREKT